MVEDEKMFIHSRCCNAHWELTYQNGTYQLECENCGEPAGSLSVTGPEEEECQCTICQKRKEMS